MRIFNRQKVLLETIHRLNNNGIKSRTANVKSQFLLKEEYFLGDKIKFYNFFPYNYGPFSQLCFHDMRQLKNEGLLDEDETKVTNKGLEMMKTMDTQFTAQITDLIKRFPSEKRMVDYVYEKYPQFTVKSKLVDNKQVQKQNGILTIGYEGRDIDTFLNILIENDINLLIDVRKNPFSMNFSFVKGTLKKYLESVDIDYLHIPELGIESADRKNLKSKQDYEKLFVKYRKNLQNKEVYINKIMELSREKKLALLCYEKDPTFCHRGQIANLIRTKNNKVVDL